MLWIDIAQTLLLLYIAGRLGIWHAEYRRNHEMWVDHADGMNELGVSVDLLDSWHILQSRLRELTDEENTDDDTDDKAADAADSPDDTGGVPADARDSVSSES